MNDRRLLFRMGVLVAALATASPALSQGTSDTPEAAVYLRLCAECHSDPTKLIHRFDADDPATCSARWTAFLGRHHCRSAEDSAALIRYFDALRQK